MRLLIVDRCPLMTWVVQHLAPPDVEVERAATIHDARHILREHPPDAAMFNVTPHAFPIKDIERLCREHRPPIPTAYHSLVHRKCDEVGLPAGSAQFFTRPETNRELKSQIEGLIALAQAESGGSAEEEATAAIVR